MKELDDIAWAEVLEQRAWAFVGSVGVQEHQHHLERLWGDVEDFDFVAPSFGVPCGLSEASVVEHRIEDVRGHRKDQRVSEYGLKTRTYGWREME